MGFLIRVLLFFLATTLSAASEPASVYLFPEQRSSSSAPTLTTEEARLIITQRLGVSQYHSLHHASKATLEFINTFGGQRSLLFSDDSKHDSGSYLVMIVEGVSLKLERLMMESFQFTEPSFKILNPPSETANKHFISDMIQGEAHIHCNLDDFNLLSEQRLTGRSGFVQFGLVRLLDRHGFVLTD